LLLIKTLSIPQSKKNTFHATNVIYTMKNLEGLSVVQTFDKVVEEK